MILNAQGVPIQSEQAAQQEVSRIGKLMQLVIPVLAAQQCTLQEGADLGLNMIINYFGALPDTKTTIEALNLMQKALASNTQKLIEVHRINAKKAKQLMNAQAANRQRAPS